MDHSDLDVDGVIARTTALTEAVRDYMLAERDRPRDADPMRQLAAIQQTSRLANFLAGTMSWLMWRKAELAGEITMDKLAEETRDLLATPRPEFDDRLSPSLTALVGQSRDLFEQVRPLIPA